MNEVPQLDNLQAADTRASADMASVDQIDLLCDEYEMAWLAGESPQIEDFLDRCGEAVRDRLLTELLLVDRELRIRRGETASRCDYLERFPQYSTAIGNLDFPTIDERSPKRRSNLIDNLPSLAGTRLAQFELLEELGSGASGAVWKARDSRLRRIVAIKIPRNGSLTEAERERFLREGQAAAQLQHPNIVTVYEVGEDRGQLFIVAKFIDGLSLKEWLKQYQPKPREAAELAAQLAEALHHAHEQGVIHRDLKPANVLMDREGHPHITDFGLAKWSSDAALMTVEGNILGTPAYMSPEQARGDTAHVDRRTDVYGLGALLYEMLIGQPPFQGDIATIVHQVVHDDPQPPSRVATRIPRDLETICLKAMEKEPSRRYPSAQETAVDLRRFLRGEPILARRTGPLERSWRWLRRRPAVAVSFVLAALVAAAGIALASLVEQNYQLEGYQHVRIETDPPGAMLAIVPIDDRTNEPNPDPTCIVRPQDMTPLTTELRPGEYLIEAVMWSENGKLTDPNFAEVRRTVPHPDTMSWTMPHLEWQYDRNNSWIRLHRIDIPRTEEVVATMSRVPISKFARRENPLLPRALYVDVKETAPGGVQDTNSEIAKMAADGDTLIPFEYALSRAESTGARLPTDAEYDAIAEYVERQSRQKVKLPAQFAIDPDISGGKAEWTTTRLENDGISSNQRSILSDVLILRGFSSVTSFPNFHRTSDGRLLRSRFDPSPFIGYRRVRSDAPRFANPTYRSF